MAETPDAFFATLKDHARQLGELQTEVGSLKTIGAETNRKIDKIFELINEQRANRPTGWDKVLSVVKDGAILLGLCVGAILYVANGQSAPKFAVMEYRIEQAEKGDRSRVMMFSPQIPR